MSQLARRSPQTKAGGSGDEKGKLYRGVFEEGDEVTKNMNTRLPKILQDVSPDFDWDRKKIWELDLPVQEMDTSNLVWHFDLPFWEKEGTDEWNLTPWEVIRHPGQEPSHYAKVLQSDLRHPLDIIFFKGRYRVLDGLHRLVKAYMEGYKTVRVRIIPPELFDLII